MLIKYSKGKIKDVHKNKKDALKKVAEEKEEVERKKEKN